MSSEIIYKENNRINAGDENIFVKSDKGRAVIRRPGISPGPKFLSLQRFILIIKSVFLPEGFPDSVHPDYIPYQLWDTVQAFASTILGTLTTHSILVGVGVGESTATPLAATISWILKDGAGMIGRILFAWWNGSQLDAQSKKWRIFADILNDIAMGIELLLPYFSNYTTLILCATTSMKSLVGVAGGATRAALTQHQALNNNLADVSAKDGSQETFVNLVASFAGIFLLKSLNNSVSGGFLVYFILVVTHVYANYSAVRALKLNSLNEDRLAILLDNYTRHKTIVGVDECNKRESLFLFQKPFKQFCGFEIKMGATLSPILQRKTTSLDYVIKLRSHFRNKKYMIFPDVDNRRIYVGLNENIESSDVLEAFFHSYLWGIEITSADCETNEEINETITRIIINNKSHLEFKSWHQLLGASDWKREINLLPVGEWRARWDL